MSVKEITAKKLLDYLEGYNSSGEFISPIGKRIELSTRGAAAHILKLKKQIEDSGLNTLNEKIKELFASTFERAINKSNKNCELLKRVVIPISQVDIEQAAQVDDSSSPTHPAPQPSEEDHPKQTEAEQVQPSFDGADHAEATPHVEAEQARPPLNDSELDNQKERKRYNCCSW